MKDTNPTFLELRILVLTLGEIDHAGWWKSKFMSPIGLRFLERLYPRSTFAAAVRSAGRAAKLVHDAKVGKGEVFHLFRFSPEVERKFNVILADRSSDLRQQYQSLLADKTALLTTLEKLAGQSEVPAAVGPLRLPAEENLSAAMAAAYLGAFRTDSQVFPYFEEKVNF